MKKVRRFAPEPVETSTRSSKKEKSKDASAEGNGSTGVEDKPAGKRRFAPVPFEETTYKSSKRPANTMPSSAPSSSSTEASSTSADASKPRRKFVPELIETTKRSKKKGDTRPATLPTDKVCGSLAEALSPTHNCHIDTCTYHIYLDRSYTWRTKHIRSRHKPHTKEPRRYRVSKIRSKTKCAPETRINASTS